MIIDHIKNIGKYPQLDDYAEEINGFIRKWETEAMEAGRYELLPEHKLFALVQYYETRRKEKGRMESHEKYTDLQYILSGKEVLFYDLAQELSVEEDKRPEKDVIFYKEGPDRGGIVLTAGMFAYCGPQDAHMPCIRCGEEAEGVVKIVFKIRNAAL